MRHRSSVRTITRARTCVLATLAACTTISTGPSAHSAAQTAAPPPRPAVSASPPADRPGPASTVLWYRQHATAWLDALPVGNGRLGAMAFGHPNEDRVQLNENTLWDGFTRDTTNPDALKNLPDVRRLIFEGKHAEATALVQTLLGRPQRIKPYQSLGDLLMAWDIALPVTGYRRELDLARATARVTFTADGVTYTREVFASAPDRVLVIRLTADRPGKITTRLRLARQQDAASSTESGRLILRGQIDRRLTVTGENRGVRFEAHVAARTEGGSARTQDNGLVIDGADAATIFISAATSFRHGDPGAICRRDLDAALQRSFDAVRAEHEADHQRYFNRVTLDVGRTAPDVAALPTDERLSRLRRQPAGDPELLALYFQMGRYLLIGSSRPGQLPANLQGLWNDLMNPPWNADYHTNINLQMNYWPAENANLSELHQPFFDYVRERLVESGQRTARAHYNARGWVVHHLSDVWGFTTPADGVQGVWPMGAAWIARHFWEHYEYTGDRAFLQQQAYPVMKGAAEFILDFLIEDPKGRLVTSPSHSPENAFRLPDGTTSKFTYAATMDLQIIHDLFTRTMAAARVLNIDAPFVATLEQTLKRLPPLQVSQSGRLQEWIEDYDEPEPGHRHMSHLYAVFPGDQITLRGTPALAAAARKSLDYRLSHKGGQTGWSRAWIINFFARFEDGDAAHDSLVNLLRENTTDTLLDLHPPRIFQIDGNLGATAGVAELLLQSHDGVHLLPALPKAWRDGRVTGLRARGGVEVDITWRDGRLASAVLRPSRAGDVRLRAAGLTRVTQEDGRGSVRTTAAADGVLTFQVEAGKVYRID